MKGFSNQQKNLSRENRVSFFSSEISFVRSPAYNSPSRRSIYPFVLAEPDQQRLAGRHMISSGAGGPIIGVASQA
jgi:hypothetical protein